MASVASTNLYAFLNDNDEGNNIVPSPVVPAAPKDKKQAAKDKKAAAKPAATTTAATADKNRGKPTGTRSNAPATRSATEDRNYEAESRDANRTRRGGGAPRRGRGGRGGRGREFDRHSGTGLVDSNKKVEQSWGHTGADYSETDKATTKSNEEVVEEVPEEEQGPVVKTLDEYLSERAEKLKIAGIDTPDIRKVKTDDKWKNTRVLKNEESNFFVGKSQTTTQKQKTKKTKKVVVNIEQRFVEENFGRGRGGSRGGGSRGGRGGNSGRSGTNAMNVDDQSAFPALG